MKTKSIEWLTAAVVVLSIGTIFGQVPVPLPESTITHKIDSIFSDWNKSDTPGGIVSVVSHGEVIYKKAFGMADLEKKIPNRVESTVDLASITKQFTGMCIALLEEQGKLSTEDDIRKYYPKFQFGQTIKIKNLLNHSSGIREAYVLAVLSGKVNLKGEVPKRFHTKTFLIQVLERETDLNFPPGDEMVYTNVNYILLGDIVEKVSGMTLPAFADSAIFKPLGMRHTLFRDKQKMKIAGLSTGYLYNGKKFKKQTPLGGVLGDGNLVSTVNDLTLWDQNFFHNKLGKQDMKLIDRISTSSLLNNGDTAHYGYGLFIGKHKGLLKVHHGGDNGMHTSTIIRFPKEEFTVICLANSSRYNDTENKAYGICDVMLGNRFAKTSNENEPTGPVSVGLEFLKKRDGVYCRIDEKGLGSLRRITYKDSTLFISGNYNATGQRLTPVGGDDFYFRNSNGKLHVHFKDSANKSVMTTRWRELAPIDFEPIKKDLKIKFPDYKGAYFNASTKALLKVKSRKGKIVARKGVIRIPLIPFDQDIFYATENDALFIFERDEKGRVKELKINAHDFRQFRLVKR